MERVNRARVFFRTQDGVVAFIKVNNRRGVGAWMRSIKDSGRTFLGVNYYTEPA